MMGGACYFKVMSELTIEVEVDHGRIIPKGNVKLPEKATGYLRLVTEDAKPPLAGSLTLPPNPMTAKEADEFLDGWQEEFTKRKERGEDVSALAALHGRFVREAKIERKPLSEEEAKRWVDALSGFATIPEEDPNDPRLNYLLRKYCR